MRSSRTSQKPFSSSPAIRRQKTGSESKRGKHHHTSWPCCPPGRRCGHCRSRQDRGLGGSCRQPVFGQPAPAIAAPRAGTRNDARRRENAAHRKALPAQLGQNVKDIHVGGVVAAEQDGAAGETASGAPGRAQPRPCRCPAAAPRSPPCHAGYATFSASNSLACFSIAASAPASASGARR